MGRSRIDPAILKPFGRNIRELRKAKGLKPYQLANEAGMSPANIYNIENGIQGTTLGRLYSIAAALGVKPADLLPDPESITLPQAA